MAQLCRKYSAAVVVVVVVVVRMRHNNIEVGCRLLLTGNGDSYCQELVIPTGMEC